MDIKDLRTTTKQLSPQATLDKYFTQHKAQLVAALPKHLTPDRMARLAMTCLSQNKALANCDPKTVFASVIIASQLGLEIGVLGQAFLVPYKTTCQLIPGWMGLVDLVNRAGQASVWTGAVFQGDEFEYALGDRPFIQHKPCGEDDPAMLTHVYAVGRVKGSEWPVIEVWPMRRVLSHRDRGNKQGDKHYSFKYPEMYARKLPLLQVLKYMPKSVELQKAMQADHAAESGKPTEIINGEFVTLDTETPEEQQGEAQDTEAQPEAEQAPPAKAQATPGKKHTFE